MSEWRDEQYGRALIDNPVLAQGIRRQESEARSTAPLCHMNNRPGRPKVFDCQVWRPILNGSLEEVFQIHKRSDLEPNPLYKMAAKRVGCFPCIFSGKPICLPVLKSIPVGSIGGAIKRSEWLREQETATPRSLPHAKFLRDFTSEKQELETVFGTPTRVLMPFMYGR
jgi:3'-phosphoadenosine 5'-phosphosulfate sulfotransferase (PAPS reductase)/FAD synthetase